VTANTDAANSNLKKRTKQLSTAFLKQLLGHIDRTSIQTDPVYLLVAIPRDKAEEGWSIVMAEETKKLEKQT